MLHLVHLGFTYKTCGKKTIKGGDLKLKKGILINKINKEYSFSLNHVPSSPFFSVKQQSHIPFFSVPPTVTTLCINHNINTLPSSYHCRLPHKPYHRLSVPSQTLLSTFVTYVLVLPPSLQLLSTLIILCQFKSVMKNLILISSGWINIILISMKSISAAKGGGLVVVAEFGGEDMILK